MNHLIVIGAPKCATTSLYELFSLHPKMCVSTLKEPNYFAIRDGKFESVFNEQFGLSSIRKYPPITQNWNEYIAQFEETKSTEVRVDVSPIYMFSKYSARNIFEKFGKNVKIIAILRNPVDRAYSQFLHHRRDGFEKSTNFKDVFFSKEESSGEGPFWNYKEMGYYAKQLKSYYELFNKEAIHVVQYEEFRNNRESVISEIFDFIGLEKAHVRMNTSANMSGLPKNKLANYLLTMHRRNAFLKRMVFSLPTPMRLFFQKLKNKNLKRTILDQNIGKLCFEVYKEDIKELEEMTKQDYSAWDKY